MILNLILESKDSRREVHLNIRIETIIKKESLNQFRFFFLLLSANKKRAIYDLFYILIILESEFFWIFELKFLW